LSYTSKYTIATIICRLYFHPLVKFPGSFCARISGFPAYYHTFKKDRHIWFYQLQEQHGRLSRYMVVSAMSIADDVLQAPTSVLPWAVFF
jgi:hypothetical protein